MARKRAKGEGTIRKRADGLWEARLPVPGGIPKSFYGKTQAEAVEKRAEAKRALEDGYSLDSGKQTVGETSSGGSTALFRVRSPRRPTRTTRISAVSTQYPSSVG